MCMFMQYYRWIPRWNCKISGYEFRVYTTKPFFLLCIMKKNYKAEIRNFHARKNQNFQERKIITRFDNGMKLNMFEVKITTVHSTA